MHIDVAELERWMEQYRMRRLALSLADLGVVR
jgi:hypothetical protein